MKSHKIVHKRSECIGCNACVTLAPNTWEMDKKTGKSRLLSSVKKKDVYVGEIFECDVEQNRKAQRACPMRIIKVEN